MIPLISSICYGPAGLCHLPRFWWKASLGARGLLADDYPECSGGLDKQLLGLLHLTPDAALGHIREHLPDYLEFETWVTASCGGRIDEEMMSEWNPSVRERVHTRPHKLAEIYNTLGWDDGRPGPRASGGELPTSAVILNHLEDWHYSFHRDLDGDALDGYRGKVIPLISTLDCGTLGVCQLPRTWQKILLEARGLLNSDYPGCGGGLDKRVLLLRCTPSDVAGCRQAVIACDGSVGRSVPSAPYVWNIGMG